MQQLAWLRVGLAPEPALLYLSQATMGNSSLRTGHSGDHRPAGCEPPTPGTCFYRTCSLVLHQMRAARAVGRAVLIVADREAGGVVRVVLLSMLLSTSLAAIISFCHGPLYGKSL